MPFQSLPNNHTLFCVKKRSPLFYTGVFGLICKWMRGTKFSSAANPKSIQSLCRLWKQYTLLFGIWLEVFFLSTKSHDDLWRVTEMHLVNSVAVIRLDTHKHRIMNWTQAMYCLSSAFVLTTARDFEGLINTQSLERSWCSYPNKSNVLDDITAMLSPLIYICVWMYSLCQFMEEKCAFYQLPDMCFQCTWKQEYKCTHAKSCLFIWAARLSVTKELLLPIVHIS